MFTRLPLMLSILKIRYRFVLSIHLDNDDDNFDNGVVVLE